MKKELLLSLGAYSAIIAGILRCFASFAVDFLSNIPLEILYTTIDISLLFAILGLYLKFHEDLKILGLLGFIFSMIGVGILIGPDESIHGGNIYPLGAGVLSIGIILISIDSIFRKILTLWIPGLWLLSFILGPIGFYVKELNWIFIVSGIMFGFGFIGLGFTTLKWLNSKKVI